MNTPSPMPPVYTHYHPPASPSHFWRNVGIAIVVFVLAMVAFAVLAGIGLVGSLLDSSENMVAKKSFKLEEEHLSTYGNPEAKATIAVVDISGIIIRSKGSEAASSETLCPLLRELAKRPEVHAIILNLDTPGGEVTASDEIYREVVRLREEHHLPVVACMRSLCASGGYYIAAASDHIVANPHTLTGSIGVIFNTYNYKGLLEKVGVQDEVYKSGELKDILNGARERTEKEKVVIQALVAESYTGFATVVSNGRKKQFPTADAVKQHPVVGDARVISGSQAKAVGLVDQLGYFDDAVKSAAKLASLGEGNYKVVRYQAEGGLFALLFGAKAQQRGDLRSLLPPEMRYARPGCLYYLYSPVPGAP